MTEHNLEFIEDGQSAGYQCRVCGWKWTEKPHEADCPGIRRFTDRERCKAKLMTAEQLSRVGKEPGPFAPVGVISGKKGIINLYRPEDGVLRRNKRTGQVPAAQQRGVWYLALGNSLTVRKDSRETQELPEPTRGGSHRYSKEAIYALTPRISLPIGMTHRVVKLYAYILPEADLYFPKRLTSAAFKGGPYRTLTEVESRLSSLVVELDSPVLVSWSCFASYSPYRIDAEGVLRYPIDLMQHPELGLYNFGTTYDLAIRMFANWMPKGMAIDYEPERTQRLVKWLEKFKPEERPCLGLEQSGPYLYFD